VIKIFTLQHLDVPQSEKDKLKNDVEMLKCKLNLKKENNISNICKYDELTEFINELFTEADTEDKSEKVSLRTAALFRLMVDLTELLTIWKPLDEEWIKFSKNIII